jgi:tetrahydromethanopterin S-methyltransferase subunit G
MGVVEDVHQVLQDFLAPEMREIRTRLDAMDEIGRIRYEAILQRLDTMDKRSEFHEEAIRARFDNIVQRLETIQQSFAFDKRISNLEDEKRRSA